MVLVVSMCVICSFSAMNMGLLVFPFFIFYGNTPLDSEYWGFLGLRMIVYSVVS